MAVGKKTIILNRQELGHFQAKEFNSTHRLSCFVTFQIKIQISDIKKNVHEEQYIILFSGLDS